MVMSGIYIKNTFCPHDFHIVSDDTTMGIAEGILGSDFLKKYKSVLSYNDEELKIVKPKFLTKEKEELIKVENEKLNAQVVSQPQVNNENNESFNSKMISKLFITENTPKEVKYKKSTNEHSSLENKNALNKIILKPRAQNIIYWPVGTSNDLVVQKKQIDSGIIIGNSVERPKAGLIRLAILNARETEYTLKKGEFEPEYSELHNFVIVENKENVLRGLERKERLKSLINLSHCNKEEKEKVLEICLKFDNIFYLKGDKLSSTNAATHRIPLLHNTLPINTKPYRLPYFQRENLEDEIQKLLNDGVISPSKSPWCSPILLVPKKPDATGKRKWRLCIDFRKINEKTITDAYPLPNITDIQDQLGKANYFSTLDLERGYWQVEMDPNDKEITAFKANGRLYEWLRMPMGVKNAAPTFQRMVNNVLLGLQGEICFIYVDDLILYANDLKDHNRKLQLIFERLENFKLKINPEKCAFLRTEINFLGHVVSNAGLFPDPRKIEAVMKFPIPKNQKELKSFLGLASYYRKFIEKTCLRRTLNSFGPKNATKHLKP